MTATFRQPFDLLAETAVSAGRAVADGTGGSTKTEIWLGRQDSNLGMAESKSAALPLGYAPLAPSWRSHASHGRGAARTYTRKVIWRQSWPHPPRQPVLAGQGHGRYNARSPDAIPWDIDDPHRGMHRGAVPADRRSGGA